MVKFQSLGLGVGIDVGTFSFGSCFIGNDADATFWSNDIFDEKSDLTHHRAPSCFIPTDRTIIEGDLEVAVVDFSFGEFISESCAEPRYADGLGFGHLAHHIDVVNAAIDDRRNR